MKYIIDVDEDRVSKHGKLELLCEVENSLPQYIHTAIDARPYNEPDRKTIEDEVWEFVRTVTDMTEAQRIQCFGGATCNLDDYLTYQEAKSKYEVWLKNEINILNTGDEVWNDEMSCKGVVLTVCDTGIVDVLWSDRDIECVFYKKLHKTGRHFDEVAELLKKMRGEQDE